MSIKRRTFLKAGFGGSLALSLRSAALGLPASFLVNGSVNAADVSAKYTILSVSGRGESISVNGPDTYGEGLASKVAHPNAGQVGDFTLNVNGTHLTPMDLQEGADVSFGRRTYRAAKAYQALDESFRDNLAFFMHRTGTNAHPEITRVLEGMGSIRNEAGRGSEQLPSVIAQELAPILGTSTAKPIVLDGHITYKGSVLGTYKPKTLKEIIMSGSGGGVRPEDFKTLYDWTLNKVYRNVKKNGSPRQKQFLDSHLQSRDQAADLGDQLGELLSDIDNDYGENQLRAALALVKVKFCPVVVVHHNFGDDNHADELLRFETEQTFHALYALNSYWKLLQEYNLTDEVLYATVDVFGRTPSRNWRGGRDHYGAFTAGMIHGSHINGGVIGSLAEETVGQSNFLRASGINSQTGGAENADISGNETLMAFMKSVMAAAGVSETRRDIRLPDGKVVSSLYV